MSFGLYKAGQGYWVRVLAASMGGIVVMAACAWAWNELDRAAAFIPKPTANLTLAAPVTGTATPGQAVRLLGDPPAPGAQPEEIGAAVVQTDQPQSNGQHRVTLERIQIAAKHDLSQVKSLGDAPAGATLSGKLLGGASPINLFDPLYVRGAGVGILMLAGAALTWWVVGVKPRTVEFLIATDGEMKKVNWSTRKDVLASTWVVILWSVLLAGGLFLVDFLFSGFFKLIHVLQT
jgi:preprotein translocase SecE subunit